MRSLSVESYRLIDLFDFVLGHSGMEERTYLTLLNMKYLITIFV